MGQGGGAGGVRGVSHYDSGCRAYCATIAPGECRNERAVAATEAPRKLYGGSTAASNAWCYDGVLNPPSLRGPGPNGV